MHPPRRPSSVSSVSAALVRAVILPLVLLSVACVELGEPEPEPEPELELELRGAYDPILLEPLDPPTEDPGDRMDIAICTVCAHATTSDGEPYGTTLVHAFVDEEQLGGRVDWFEFQVEGNGLVGLATARAVPDGDRRWVTYRFRSPAFFGPSPEITGSAEVVLDDGWRVEVPVEHLVPK